MKKIRKVVVGLLLTACVVFLAMPVGSVFAQGEEPPQVETELPRGSKGLEALFIQEVERYEKAGEGIAKSAGVAEKLECWITKRVESGKDASELESILSTFQENMVTVEDAYAEVGELIDDHAGFDVDGKVVDESLAVYTLRQIAEGLLEVHRLREDARFALRWDLMEYRYSLRNPD